MQSTTVLLFLMLSVLQLAVSLAAPTNPQANSVNESISEGNGLDSNADDRTENLQWEEFEKGLLQAISRSRWTDFRDDITDSFRGEITTLVRQQLAAEAVRRAEGALFG
ncbi:unnamed protein product [Allacma fusca]|uniref:Uncharacterized protein n=1 Tax=Allacma fusca TaxID=39272 RepID=A0A8J2L6U1_9HEXA|nr:unnamed protein product [Allacma fusca]